MKRFVLPLFLLLVCPLYARTSYAGTWKITGDVQGHPVNDVCTFTQDGNKLSGTCQIEGKTFDTTGAIDEKNVTFSHAGEYQGQPLTIIYTAPLTDEDTLAGSIDVQPMQAAGTFTAKKAESKDKHSASACAN